MRKAADVKVEIWSDVVCPWCAIGKRRFSAALQAFDHADEVDIVWRSFELDPHAPRELSGDLADHLAAKYGRTREQAVQMQADMTRTAADEGLTFRFDRARSGNTFDAHRLLHLARDRGVADALKDALFSAYLTDGAAIGDPDTLVRVAAGAGLDADEARAVLDTGKYGDDVRFDEQEAHDLGISGVPFFVIDRRYGVSGAQPPAVLLQALEQAWAANTAQAPPR